VRTDLFQIIQKRFHLNPKNIALPKKKLANLLILISTIGLVGSFFLVVPIGTGPDSGAHSVMTYCANGSQNQVCEFEDLQEDIVYRKVKIPSGVSGIGICHGNNLEKNASCDEPWRSKGLTSFYLNTEAFQMDSSTLLYREFLGNRHYKIYLDETKRLRLTVNNKDVIQYELNDVSKMIECKWPCNTALSETRSTAEIPIVTIIPNTTTRLLMVLYGKKLIMEHNDFENPPGLDSLSNKWVNPSLTQVTSEELHESFQQIESSEEVAYFTDNYNPPFIYKFLANFITDTPRNSLENFRMASFGLIFLSLLLIFLLFLNSFYYSRFIIAFVLSSSIYGFYIFATNNTSSFSFIGCLMISAIPLLLSEEEVKFSRMLMVVYVLFAIFLSTGRVDGLFFSLAGFILMSLLKPPQQVYRLLSAILSLILFASFWFVYTNFPAAKSIHMTNGLIGSFQKITLNNFLEIPGLMLGLTGDRGPLNIWGLGQFDVPLPSIIPLACGIGVSIYVALALLNMKLKSFVVVLVAVGIWFLPFALTLASYQVAPGGWMFARYGLSQYGILMLILVVLAVPVNSSKGENSKLFVKPLVFGITSTLFATFVCIFVIAAKYMNGILLDRKDGFLPAIKYLGEWVPTVAVHYREIDTANGWSPYLIENPFVLLTLIVIIMSLLVSSLIFSLKQEEKPLPHF
jgi:hypothetical protein